MGEDSEPRVQRVFQSKLRLQKRDGIFYKLHAGTVDTPAIPGGPPAFPLATQVPGLQTQLSYKIGTILEDSLYPTRSAAVHRGSPRGTGVF